MDHPVLYFTVPDNSDRYHQPCYGQHPGAAGQCEHHVCYHWPYTVLITMRGIKSLVFGGTLVLVSLSTRYVTSDRILITLTGITSLVIGGTLVLVSLNTNSIGGFIPLCTGIQLRLITSRKSTSTYSTVIWQQRTIKLVKICMISQKPLKKCITVVNIPHNCALQSALVFL